MKNNVFSLVKLLFILKRVHNVYCNLFFYVAFFVFCFESFMSIDRLFIFMNEFCLKEVMFKKLIERLHETPYVRYTSPSSRVTSVAAGE